MEVDLLFISNKSTILELWIVISVPACIYLMISDLTYIHDRLVELNPIGSFKGFYNFLTFSLVIISLTIQGWEGCWALVWGLYCAQYVVKQHTKI